MASIPGMLGLGGGASGSGFQGPSSANLLNPATVAQANQGFDQSQDALQKQQQFLQALQAQNGVQNQQNVFNQLQGVANGTGPNPAQAMLNNQTGNNIANQAALMAGQRGAGVNPALIARQAAQQGGALQQNAVGQGAALQAQQSLNAMNQLGGIAGQQVGQQAGATNALNQQAQNAYGQTLGAIQGQNNANMGMQSNINNANAGLAQKNMGAQQNAFSNLMGAAGTGLGMMFGGPAGALAGGALASTGSSMLDKGLDKAFDSGSTSAAAASPFENAAAEGGEVKNGTIKGPRSNFGKHIHGIAMAKGGQVPALVSPGEKYLPPQAVEKVKQGANPMQVGETIPGKPKVGGAKNDYANDTVPKTLKEGGIVLPRSVTQAKDPSTAAAKFVAAIMKKDALKGKK